MPKRFTATEKWVDPWFCSLTDNEKLFWLYLLDNCNHAGIWEPNWFMFGVYVRNFTYNPQHFENRILELPSKKWYIPKFIVFQYGGVEKLNPENKAHASVLSILEKEGATKPLHSPLLGAMVMVKDMDKDSYLNKKKERLHEDIPNWINSKIWADFVEMRKRNRKPLTGAAIRLTISALDKLRAQGHNPDAVLNQSIQNSWQGVFPLREEFKRLQGNAAAPVPGKYDGLGEKA
jgi:hypothetical protein